VSWWTTNNENSFADINAKLAQNPTSVSGLTLRLIRVPVDFPAAKAIE